MRLPILFLASFLFVAEGQVETYPESVKEAGYQASCTDLNCKQQKNLLCLPETLTCGCGDGETYDLHFEGCLKPPTPTNSFSCQTSSQCQLSPYGAHSECHRGQCKCAAYSDDSYRYRVIQRDQSCWVVKEIGDPCESPAECGEIGGNATCLGLGSDGSCQCAEGHVWDLALRSCLPVGTQGSACQSDFQCRQGLGPLSRCRKGKCECWDTEGGGERDTGHYETKCYYRRRLDQTCKLREECALGYHERADCRPVDAYSELRVCQCPQGERCAGSAVGVSLTLLLLSGVLVSLR